MSDELLDGGGVAALLGQVLQGLHGLLHQLGVIGLQLAWNTAQPGHILTGSALRLYTRVCLH